MSLSRAVATLALVLAVAILGWLLFLRGQPGHEYTFVFENAGQLVRDNDVQVGGRRVGSITDIELTDDNQAAVTVKVQEPFAPLREGTEATIRLTSLSGIANRYIALAMGPGDAPELDDGAVLGTNTTTSVVDLDQLFNTLDEKTRGSLQDLVKGFAAQYEGRSEEASMAVEYFNPLLSTSRRLVGELTEDEPALTRFIIDTVDPLRRARREARRPRGARRQRERDRPGRSARRTWRSPRRSACCRRRSGAPTRPS